MYGQIDAQTSTNSCQIRPKDSQEHKEKLQAPCYSNFPERKWSPGLRWDNFSSHTITLFGNDAFIQLSKLAKVGHDIAIFNGNVLGHAWQTWCKRGTNGYRGWVVLYLYATCKFSNQLTLEQWAFEYGLPFFIRTVYIIHLQFQKYANKNLTCLNEMQLFLLCVSPNPSRMVVPRCNRIHNLSESF